MIDPVRAFALFEQAVALDPAGRNAWLDSACAGDTDLRREVLQLLEADSRANDFLGAPLVVDSDRSGERLGAWRLQKLLGSGGMGSVYLAARADGSYEKLVAIKFLLFDAGDLRRRFALEQRILGAMTHPNIAALLDVGTDARGAPYFVMEFVDGVAITRYVADHALDLRARVALFLPILAAMQTAHSQLVVHRDVKPSNVLVDANGNPKLLDFGIAKLLGDREPIATRTGLGPLTPEYASPEQARGVPIGTPSDIYSLGVLLYELVTGERPYRIDDQSPTGIERAICNIEPLRPSARMTAHASGESLRDLDAIILKAMEKQSPRRYGSCAEFAADLNRWLEGRTVTAREPSPRERVLRYLYRHRLAVSVAAAIAVALLVGLGAALWEARVARDQTRIALTERDRAQSVIHFLTDTLSAASPENLGRNVTVLEVLQHARTNLPRDLDDHPDVAATVQKTLADTFLAVGDLQSARECAENALAIARREGDQNLIIESELSVGYILRQNGDLKAARPVLESARAAALPNGSATQRAASAEMLGLLASTNNDVKAAQRWYAIALDEVPADDAGLRGELMNNMAIAKEQDGDAKAAVDLHRQALKILLDANEHSNPRLAKSWINLANAEDETGDVQAAAVSFEKGLSMQIELDGDKHPDVVNTLSTMAMFYLDRGDGANALAYGARAVEGAKALSETNLQVPYARYSYARALLFSGDAKKAIPLLQSALSERVAIYSATHPQSLITQSWLGLAMVQAGDRAAGAELTRRAYAQLRATVGDDHVMTKRALGNVEKVAALK